MAVAVDVDTTVVTEVTVCTEVLTRVVVVVTFVGTKMRLQYASPIPS